MDQLDFCLVRIWFAVALITKAHIIYLITPLIIILCFFFFLNSRSNTTDFCVFFLFDWDFNFDCLFRSILFAMTAERSIGAKADSKCARCFNKSAWNRNWPLEIDRIVGFVKFLPEIVPGFFNHFELIFIIDGFWHLRLNEIADKIQWPFATANDLNPQSNFKWKKYLQFRILLALFDGLQANNKEK